MADRITNPVPVLDGLAIAAGRQDTYATVHKFGENTDLDAAVEETIWDGGGIWVPPTEARTHDIASSDANDTSAGTGARTIKVFGLDASGVLTDETVTMNGVSNVATVNTYTMVYRMHVVTAGSGGQNAGAITATAQIDDTVTAQISATLNQTLMAVYKVPAATTAYVFSWYASLLGATNSNVDIGIYCLDPNADAVYRPVQIQGLKGAGSSHIHHCCSIPIQMAANTIITLQATADGNNQSVSGGFDLVLVS